MSSTKTSSALFVSIIICALLLPFFCRSSLKSRVVINEIAWMGDNKNWRNEWMELYNNTNKEIDLFGWKIILSGEKEIKLTGIISAHNYFLLERGSDNTIAEVKSDMIYKNILNNDGLNIMLLDNKGNLVDSIECKSGWFEGSNLTKRTMERIDANAKGSEPRNWQTSIKTEGTPRAQNSQKKADAKHQNSLTIEKERPPIFDYQSIFTPILQGLFFSLTITCGTMVYKLKLARTKDS